VALGPFGTAERKADGPLCNHAVMNSLIAVQDTYPDDFAHCYGCGKNNEQGLRIKTYLVDDHTVTDHTPEPFHTGAKDFAYGGIVASLIDCHSTGSAAIFWMRANGIEVGSEPAARFVTARLEVDFVAPTPLGPLHLVGESVEVAERKVIVTTELTGNGAITARGRAVLVRVR